MSNDYGKSGVDSAAGAGGGGSNGAAMTTGPLPNIALIKFKMMLLLKKKSLHFSCKSFFLLLNIY